MKWGMTLTALLVAAGVTWGKPPGPGADPRVTGQERSPIEREFHEGTGAVRTISYYRLADAEGSSKPLPIVSLYDWMVERIEKGFTIPLGPLHVPE